MGNRWFQPWWALNLDCPSPWYATENGTKALSSFFNRFAEPRLRIGIPVVGCPDYAKLIAQRAQTAGVPFAPPYYPEHLRSYVDKHDPASCPFRAKDWSNPFLGKRILILSGGKDTLVPWSVSKDFAEGLYIGDGVKRVVVEEDAGHECTPVMIKEIVLFIQDWLNGE